MKLQIDIPDKILQALKNGIGRDKLAELFGLSSTDARKFTGAYELSNIGNKTEFYEITESDEVEESAKVLLLDIETAPLESYTWGLWKQNVSINQIKSDWFSLTWSAKWLHDPEILSNRLTSKEAVAEDDSRIIQNIWGLMDEADIVIAHNGDRFDIPKLNTRFILHGIRLPSPYQTIDTCTASRRRFGFTSNKLDYIAQFLGVGQKIKTDFDLWKGCRRGDVEALKKMEEYNKMDVVVLESVYLKIRAYVKNHPNLGLFIDSDDPMCPVCTSKNIIPDGYYCTSVSKFQVYHCEDCFAPLRGRQSMVDKGKRKDLKVSQVR